MNTKTKLDGNSRETCCLLCAGVNGILAEIVHLRDSRTLTACSVSSELGFRHGQLRPFMTGDVNGSSDLCSVPSGVSHAQCLCRESRPLHVAPMTWDPQLEVLGTVGNSLWIKACLRLKECKVISLGSAGFFLLWVPTF